MTSIANLIQLPGSASPNRVLYPAGPGEADACWACFQPRNDLATTADRRVGAGELVRVCLSCHHALASGRPVELPSRDALPELLRSWARWDANGEVDDEFVLRMFAALLPGLSEDEAADWFLCLQGALAEVQERSEFGFELFAVPPEDRDVERLLADSIEKADECIAKLMGGAR
ncbi:MAG: hypothetical protein ACRDQ0_03195 [Pseudonocardia sp.]